jgi:hypothetical protein
MKDNRKRQLVKVNYVNALELVAYCFASCEWQVNWCCEKIRPGSLKKVAGDEITAGKIAKHFLDLTRNMPKFSEREELKAAAKSP